MDLTQNDPARSEPLTLQPDPTVSTQTPALTESSATVRALSENGFGAIYGDRSAEALEAFNTDVAERGPHAALDQLAERPNAYIPGAEPSPISHALAGSLRLSLPEGDTRPDTRSDTRADAPSVDDTPKINVNGVTTEKPFPKEVGPTETQESVLRRSFEEYAFKAGISNERIDPDGMSPREVFVEERMMANLEANEGKYRIFNPDTDAAYTAEEWAARQQAGTITMYPADGDMEALVGAQQQTHQDQGTRLANDVLEALNASEELSAARLLGFTDPEARLASLMEQVGRRQGDIDFQRGFVEGLRPGGFIRLSQTYADHSVYSTLLTQSLSEAIAEREGVITVNASDGGTANIAVAIARRADSETLARLVTPADHGLGTDFLVEAATQIRNTEPNAWPTREAVLKRAAEDPNAALTLLQDPDFVRDTLDQQLRDRFLEVPDRSILGRFIQAGLSTGMRTSHPAEFEAAFRTVVETFGRRT